MNILKSSYHWNCRVCGSHAYMTMSGQWLLTFKGFEDVDCNENDCPSKCLEARE